MIIQNQHSAVKHKESDPYEDSSSPPPNGQHPGWRSSQRQQQQQGQQEQQEHLSGSGGGIEHHPPKQVPLIQLDPIGEKNRPWQADQDNSGSGLESGPISDTGYHSTDKEEVIVDDEANVPGSEISEVKESAVAIATQERKASPVSYAHFLSAIRRERNYAIALMVREADLAVQSTEVYSVTNKNQTAPSNDVHDYLSLSKYYWPNKNKLSGLPYKRIDGHVNPEIETVRDYRLLRTMIREVHIMGMAYHFTGRKEYADKCAMRLSEWFLDEATYMNPNINYGSLRKGEKLGARTGILDMFTIFRVFDALHYLKQEPTWPQDLIPRLQKWFSRYVQWLETASLARLERDGDNNHGTYFDVQIIGIYLFLGRVDDAREIARKALHKRIDPQINAQGMQPEELARKTSWYYSVFNLQALMTLARWGDDLGVDMWSYEGPEGQSIKKAVDFLLPFSLSGGEGWPVENLRGFDMTDYLKCLQIAWHIYGDEMYIEAIEVLEPRVQKDMDEGRIKSVSTFMCDISTLLEATVRGGQGFIWHWCLT
ncbi:alginate lyase-domain-containing protein [Gamsiella multidivaricata]|uniref:alginate lyase-domain-containing protein n=1 Tax=Gamsiella multidivaricata TaxID=101098 RepID=UPI00221F7AD5|nr:alginate lyase-domain-containing protein [Gamsiella multidivaricata]KAI7831238.1 alginate lyase-domain-containing protein [Gamsiella multidivaricata]